MSVCIPVGRLIQDCDPYSNPWGCGGAFGAHGVRQTIIAGRLLADSFPEDLNTSQKAWTLRDHIERIAYLVVHGWTDPIQIDLGMPSLGYVPEWIVVDGNHRLADADILGHSTIWADVSGEIDYACELLGVDITDNDTVMEVRP